MRKEYMKKNFKSGFSIAEMLIALTLIGVLAAMLIPSVIHNKPNKNKALFRKAYYITERVVSEMIMDEDEFPADPDKPRSLAFCDDNDDNRKCEDRGEYFCKQFASKLSTNSELNCETSTAPMFKGDANHPIDGKEPVNPQYSFITNDGIMWFFDSSVEFCDPEFAGDCGDAETAAGNLFDDETEDVDSGIASCPSGGKSDRICVYVDVTGEEPPNVLASSSDTEANWPHNPDGYWIIIHSNGKVEVPTGQPAAWLKSAKIF